MKTYIVNVGGAINIVTEGPDSAADVAVLMLARMNAEQEFGNRPATLTRHGGMLAHTPHDALYRANRFVGVITPRPGQPYGEEWIVVEEHNPNRVHKFDRA